MNTKPLYFLTLLLYFNGFCQKIDQSKKELNTKETNTQNSSQTNTHQTNRSNHNSSDNLFVDLFLYLSYYAIVGNYELENHLDNELTTYPYADKRTGNYGGESQKTTFRLDVENSFLTEKLGSNYSSYGNHFKIKGRVKQYIYGQFDQISLFENYQGKTASLPIYQFNLGYDRLRFKHFNFGFLIGATHVGSTVNKTGLNFGLHADAFIVKNYSLDTSIHWSNINNQTVRTFDIKGKYHRKNMFFALGYELLQIASPSYNYLTTGLGFYF
ncbi:hypothetical protein BWK60_06885 [Flavobacterium covae]|uniref:Uncharacterized protein n=1 Tax=Flavobacterium columnare TaxID=996 RepID=A0AA94JNQ7_9FLAO|nr:MULTISPECIES: hypothetical protein [Flavobacterium]MCH4828691.1 hypothetical protein [Flavobacterium columnare]MCH4831945.1 hypothetical protein [Flavobacterium columnare]OWP86822.1 hypothetical protein BWK60_06885 [Flavobacterium covae]QYS90484.1 hypothetical protein JJC04_10305 [Flavobacterium covae]